MDRQIVYPGSIPLDTDLLSAQRNTMVALGYLAQMVLGTSSVVDGLACTPTQPTSMSVTVGPGSITQFSVIDATAYGSLPALPTNPLVKIGVNTKSTSFALSAPTASGQVISYLIEASLLEADAGATVLPYYNTQNPAVPFSGPGNDGGVQMTERLQTVQLALKPGPAVAIGGQNVPAVDAGWVGLFVVDVTYGQQAVTAANITTLPTAPFVNWKLPQLTPGTHNLAVFQPTNQGVWTVPSGVGAVKLRIWGGGGAGGNGFGGAGGGGAGGGYSEGFYNVTPGQTLEVSVGSGGAGASTSGSTSSFGSVASAGGGAGGVSGSSNTAGVGGASGALGAGSGLVVPGGGGGDAVNINGFFLSGAGGGSQGSVGGAQVGGAVSASTNGRNGVGPGSGASGGVGSGLGGQGGPGLVLVEW